MNENLSRQDFDYKIDQKILILNKNQFKGKLEPIVLNEGPWPIQQVHTNGTVSILRNEYLERINNCRDENFWSFLLSKLNV